MAVFSITLHFTSRRPGEPDYVQDVAARIFEWIAERGGDDLPGSDWSLDGWTTSQDVPPG